jgi:hypothetical protein
MLHKATAICSMINVGTVPWVRTQILDRRTNTRAHATMHARTKPCNRARNCVRAKHGGNRARAYGKDVVLSCRAVEVAVSVR